MRGYEVSWNPRVAYSVCVEDIASKLNEYIQAYFVKTKLMNMTSFFKILIKNKKIKNKKPKRKIKLFLLN